MSALYSDDNTNSMIVNNYAGALGTGIIATGRFAAAVYGRADTTITNYAGAVLGNTDWAAGDALSKGHWAVGTYAGAEFDTIPGSNPDSPLYNIVSAIWRSPTRWRRRLPTTERSWVTFLCWIPIHWSPQPPAADVGSERIFSRDALCRDAAPIQVRVTATSSTAGRSTATSTWAPAITRSTTKAPWSATSTSIKGTVKAHSR